MKNMFEVIMGFGLIMIILFGFTAVSCLFIDFYLLVFEKTTDISWQITVLEIFGTLCILFLAKNWENNK